MQLDLSPPPRKDSGLNALIADISDHRLTKAQILARHAQGDYKPASDEHVKGYVSMKYPVRK